MSKEKKSTPSEGPRIHTKNWIILHELVQANVRSIEVASVPIQHLETAICGNSADVLGRVKTLVKMGNDIRVIQGEGLLYLKLYSVPGFTF